VLTSTVLFSLFLPCGGSRRDNFPVRSFVDRSKDAAWTVATLPCVHFRDRCLQSNIAALNAVQRVRSDRYFLDPIRDAISGLGVGSPAAAALEGPIFKTAMRGHK
jgi:hypothetical protein